MSAQQPPRSPRSRRLPPPRPALLAFAALACLLPSAGCKDKPGATASANEILIGEYASLTGQTADFGTSSHNGLMLAIEQANDPKGGGGALGKPIRVVTQDDESKNAENAVQKLINRDRVVAVLGEVATTQPGRRRGLPEREDPDDLPLQHQPGGDPGQATTSSASASPTTSRAARRQVRGGQGVEEVAVLTSRDRTTAWASPSSSRKRSAGGGSRGRGEVQGRDRDFKPQSVADQRASPDAVYVPGYYTRWS